MNLSLSDGFNRAEILKDHGPGLFDELHEVVYDEVDTIIDTSEVEDALRAYGVEVGTTTDGATEYRNVPPELPLGACHLAVDTGRDPAAFIADTPPAEPLTDGGD